jgi:hypothetical protein
MHLVKEALQSSSLLGRDARRANSRSISVAANLPDLTDSLLNTCARTALSAAPAKPSTPWWERPTVNEVTRPPIVGSCASCQRVSATELLLLLLTLLVLQLLVVPLTTAVREQQRKHGQAGCYVHAAYVQE